MSGQLHILLGTPCFLTLSCNTTSTEPLLFELLGHWTCSSNAMSGLPEIPPDVGLPNVPPDLSAAGLPAVGSVGRGGHGGGQGSLPPALQEVIRNLAVSLDLAVDVDRATSLLSGRRADRPLALGTFLDRLLLDSRGSQRHTSQSESVIAHLTGMSARTIQDVLAGVRSRGGAPKAPGGPGGRPCKRKLEVSAAEDSRLVDTDMPELMEGTINEAQVHQQLGIQHQSSPPVPSAPLLHNLLDIGQTLGGLAAFLGRTAGFVVGVCVCVFGA
jgi:hypothetical protein